MRLILVISWQAMLRESLKITIAINWNINSFLASGKFRRLLMIFANNLDLDQDRRNVHPELDPNHLPL